MNVQLTRTPDGWALTGDVELSWASGSPVSVTVNSPELAVTHSLGECVEYLRNGFTSWSPSAWWTTAKKPWRVWDNPGRTLTAEDAATDSASLHQSYLMTCVTLGGGASLVIGSLGGVTGRIVIESGRVWAGGLDDCAQPVTWFVALGTEVEVTRAFADALAVSCGVMSPAHKRREVGPVWSSWYSWFEEIHAGCIQAEIPRAAANGFEVFQIDDGWERTIGDWKCNDKFPNGLADIVRQGNDAGLTMGLWIAPFIAVADAPIVGDHPEFFVHDGDGNLKPAGHNWGQDYFAIDCTHPAAMDWVISSIQRAYDWGFRYFKFDFLNAAAIAGVRHQATGREDAYLMGMRRIRQAFHDCYIMGSGVVVGSSIGVVDGMRVGPDTAPYWDNMDRKDDPSGPAVRNALRNSVARAWLNGVIDCDPDVAFVRTHGSLLSPEGNAVTCDIARAAGVLGISDPDEWLTAGERQFLRGVVSEFKEGRRPGVRWTGRYACDIDGREVDFEPWINPRGRISDRLLVK